MIEIKDVSKWYGAFQVLTHCTTRVDKGEVVVVIAPPEETEPTAEDLDRVVADALGRGPDVLDGDFVEQLLE